MCFYEIKTSLGEFLSSNQKGIWKSIYLEELSQVPKFETQHSAMAQLHTSKLTIVIQDYLKFQFQVFIRIWSWHKWKVGVLPTKWIIFLI